VSPGAARGSRGGRARRAQRAGGRAAGQLPLATAACALARVAASPLVSSSPLVTAPRPAACRRGPAPRWEPGSYGYHGDDGMRYAASGKGEEYGPRFGGGDTVGAALHLGRQEIFFT
jgi:hypothetical protein